MYLRDITFVYDGNNDYLDDVKQLINCEKLGLIYDQINEIKRFQKGIVNLNVEQDASVCSYLLDVTYLDEETLHEKSLQCEPPRGMVHPGTLMSFSFPFLSSFFSRRYRSQRKKWKE